MKKTKKELQEMIEQLNYSVISQQRRKNRSAVPADYDEWVVEEFRKKNPREVKKIEHNLIKFRPSLAKNPERLRKLTNREIMPPVSDKADGFFFSKNGKTYGGYHFRVDLYNDLTYYKEEKNIESEVKTMIVRDLLEAIPVEDSELIQMAYGMEPYNERVSFKEISEEMGIPLHEIKSRLKNAITELRKAYISEMKL